MAQNDQIVIPIICGSSQCKNFNRFINVVSEVTIESMDLFYEGYDGSDEADYCLGCGKLGVAEDAVWVRDLKI